MLYIVQAGGGGKFENIVSFVWNHYKKYKDFVRLKQPTNKNGYSIVKSYERDFYAHAIEIEDLDGDGIKESI